MRSVQWREKVTGRRDDIKSCGQPRLTVRQYNYADIYSYNKAVIMKPRAEWKYL